MSPSGSSGTLNSLKEDKIQKLWTDSDEIFRTCPKWDKEKVIRFWV